MMSKSISSQIFNNDQIFLKILYKGNTKYKENKFVRLYIANSNKKLYLVYLRYITDIMI